MVVRVLPLWTLTWRVNRMVKWMRLFRRWCHHDANEETTLRNMKSIIGKGALDRKPEASIIISELPALRCSKCGEVSVDVTVVCDTIKRICEEEVEIWNEYDTDCGRGHVVSVDVSNGRCVSVEAICKTDAEGNRTLEIVRIDRHGE